MKDVIALIGLCLALAAVALAPARGQAPAPAEQPLIREITIEGLERLEASAREHVNAALKSKVGEPLREETARADVEALLRLGWFFRVTYRQEPVEDGVRLVFTVVENPVVTAVEFAGNTQLSNPELLAVVRVRPGQVLNREQVTSDALAIEQAYAKRGFTHARVIDIEPTREGKLIFHIFEPRIGEIRTEGNKKTREYVIRRELVVKPGDVFNENTVRQSLQNLERLNIFQEVVAVPEPGVEPGTLSLVIRVKEQRTGLAAIGVGHSNIQGLIGFIDVADTNLRGTGQRLSARVQFGADDSYQLSFTNPWIDSRRTSFTLNAYDRSILRQAVRADETFLYNEKRKGGNVTLGRPLDNNTRLFMTLRADKIGASPDQSNPVPPDLLAGATVRSIAVSGVRDKRNSLLTPSRGSYSSLGAEYAGFGGADFTKLTGELRRYWTVREPKARPAGTAAGAPRKAGMPWVYATRLMAGAIEGSPPFLDQFLVGGADTLRGFKEDRFPGQNMVLWNNELRVPLTEALQLALFADVGDAWAGDFAEGFGDPDFNLHTGYGLGIRIQTPIGPLRLDYGLNDQGGQEFHFGVGPTF